MARDWTHGVSGRAWGILSVVAILVPVLARPQRVDPLLASIRSGTAPGAFVVCFIATATDEDELGAISERLGPDDVRLFVVPPEQEGYARKINYGFAHTTEEWVFTGADDLRFHPGWLDACLAIHQTTHACVIGTDDLGNAMVRQGRHSTHSLVNRDYGACGTIDDSSKLLCELYDHNGVDVEFVETAKWRGTFAFASDAKVEHLHHLWGHGERDETYRKGDRAVSADRQLLAQRRRLWR